MPDTTVLEITMGSKIEKCIWAGSLYDIPPYLGVHNSLLLPLCPRSLTPKLWLGLDVRYARFFYSLLIFTIIFFKP